MMARGLFDMTSYTIPIWVKDDCSHTLIVEMLCTDPQLPFTDVFLFAPCRTSRSSPVGRSPTFHQDSLPLPFQLPNSLLD